MRVLLLALIVVGSLFGLAFLLPWLKEGFGIEELPLFASGTVLLAVSALGWWLANRRATGGLFAVGLAILAVPLFAYSALSVQVVFSYWRGRRLERTVRVVASRETPISWPGLDGPVGVRMDVEIEHAIGLEGNLFPPKIVMTSGPPLSYRDYFFGPMDHGIDAFLEAPVFEPPASPPRDVLLRPGRARLSYELFPSLLQRREGGVACLSDRVRDLGERGLSFPARGDLSAAWFFAAEGGVTVDLSAPLTQALRRDSLFRRDPDEWRRLMRRLEPRALEAAGFEACRPSRPGTGEICYCPPESAESPLTPRGR